MLVLVAIAVLVVLALAALVWWLTGSAHPKHDQRAGP